MTFSRFDDSLDGHPKTRRAGLAGVGLWALAIIHSSNHLTDGRIDDEWVTEKVPGRREREQLVGRLVDAGLFERNGTGWIVHDYLDYNPSRVEVLERREKAAERKRLSRGGHGVTRA